MGPPRQPALSSARGHVPVTLLFTDLQGSTELLGRLGDAAADALLRTHFGMLRDAVAGHGGHEVKSLGDGLMVAFDAVTDALACASDMQRRTARHNADCLQPPLLLRIGINAGDVICERDDYFGMAVVTAKRLCDRAQGGQILVADVVRQRCQTDADEAFGDVGSLALKGIADPVPAWEVRWQTADPGTFPSSTDPAASAASRPEAIEDGLPPVLDALRDGEFVGRSQALARIARELDRSLAGERRILVVQGEAGIGKTRLVAEAAGVARDRGATVLFGRCDEDPLASYQPFAEALAQVATMLAPHEVERLTEGADVLSLIAPDLCPGAAGTTPTADPETERHRLFTSVVELIDGLAATRPVVLVLDDLQWADRATLQMLRQVMRAPDRSRLLVLATVRDTDTERRHPIHDTLSDLRRLHVLERIELDGLDEHDVHELIAAWAGHPPSPQLVASVWRGTEGHPFFVEEVLRDLLAEGAIQERRGRLQEPALGRVPDGVRDVVRSRLGRLSDEVLRTLSTAAVIGREFRLDLLEHTGQESPDALLEALDEALGARVIEMVADSSDCCAFTHALVREVLYEQLPALRRTRLHLQLGRTLETLHADDLDTCAAQLAHHYLAAGGSPEIRERAATYATRAGANASAALAFEEAVGHFEQALGALPAGPSSARCETLLALGEARWQSGDLGPARDAFHQAAVLADELGHAELHARAALGYAGRMGYRVGVIDRPLIDLLERSLELLGGADGALEAMVVAQLAEVTASNSSRDERAALCDRAVGLARVHGDPAELAFVLRRTVWAIWGPGNAEQRLATGEELLRLAEVTGDAATAIEARLTLLTAQLELGMEAGAVDDALADVEREVQAARQPYYEWLLSSLRSMRALYDRPLHEAEDHARAALDAIHPPHHPAALELFGTQLVYIRYLQGRLAEMHASVTAYAELFPHVGAFRAARALVLAETGQHTEARAELAEIAAGGFAMVGDDPLWFTTMNTLTLVVSTLGARDCAERMHAMLSPHAGGFCALGGTGAPSCSLQRHLGMLALAAGRTDDAVEHFEMALDLNERTGVRLSVALTQLELGRALLTRDGAGDVARAHDLLRDAIGTSDALGMSRVAHRARALMGGGEDAGTPVTSIPRRFARAGSEARAALSTRTRELVGRRVGTIEDAELQRLLGSPAAQRALLMGMAASFQPRMAFGFRGEIELELRCGGASERWTFEIRRLTAGAQHRAATCPAVALRMELPTFVRLFGGELNPIGAWLDGLLDVDGDVLLAPRMIELFGGIRPFEDLTWTVEPPTPPNLVAVS